MSGSSEDKGDGYQELDCYQLANTKAKRPMVMVYRNLGIIG